MGCQPGQLTKSMDQRLFWKANTFSGVQEFPEFYGSEGSLPLLHEYFTCSSFTPDRSNPATLFLEDNYEPPQHIYINLIGGKICITYVKI
jgi:hypothetical protein